MTETIDVTPEPDPAPVAPVSPQLAIECHDLSKRFGSTQAVDQLELEVPIGSVFGLIGPNGAGKSTTFSILASLLKPDSGFVRVVGLDPAKEAKALRRKIGYMPDVLGVYESLRVDEYLRFFAASYKVPRRQWDGLVDGLLELVGLSDKRTAQVDSLSRGMKQRISLARALVHDPDLLILDEPASGLDPRARVELRSMLTELKSMGKTVLISSHILSELEGLCTEVAIMNGGKVVAAGPPRSIRSQMGGARRITVRYLDDRTEDHMVHTDEDQAALLKRLMSAGEGEIVEFAESGSRLEQIFMDVTAAPAPEVAVLPERAQ